MISSLALLLLVLIMTYSSAADLLQNERQKDRVCIVGSGNWGSAIATLIGRNCARYESFETRVNMWVYEETVEFQGSKSKLTDLINSRHENVKYLPGIQLPTNIVAVPDLAEAAKGATLLVFVLPHQFLPKLLPTIRKHANPTCRGVSLIKGLGECFGAAKVHCSPSCI